MSKIRIYELAKKLDVGNKDIITTLSQLGIEGKTHSSSIDHEVAVKVESIIKGTPGSKPVRQEDTAKVILVEEKAKPAVTTAQEKSQRSRDVGQAPPLPEKETVVEEAATEAVTLIEEVELKVPDRFKKEIETEKVEKFKAKPAMQRAFQTVRKIEPRKWHDAKSFKKQGKDRGMVATKMPEKFQPQVTVPRKKQLKIREGTTVKEFAELISVKISEVIKKFMDLGYMPTINQPVDMDAALLIAEGFGVKLEISSIEEETVLEEKV
ncbi:MAG: translation initiation factor IF-2 N-terminal domain-containing protein, partial [Thermodesulfovibrionales bacterium]